MAEIKKEESLVQLTLTYDEATILQATCTLGLSTFAGDPPNIKMSTNLLKKAIELWPEAGVTLAKKMQALAKTTFAYSVKELDEVIRTE